MKIINNCSYGIIAFGWDTRFGYGDDVEIPAGQSAEVSGPCIGEMDGGACYLFLEGEVVCHEGEDNNDGMHVSEGKLLVLKSGTKGITVRHCCDERDV
jgi:hypothetical protein